MGSGTSPIPVACGLVVGTGDGRTGGVVAADVTFGPPVAFAALVAASIEAAVAARGTSGVGVPVWGDVEGIGAWA